MEFSLVYLDTPDIIKSVHAKGDPGGSEPEKEMWWQKEKGGGYEVINTSDLQKLRRARPQIGPCRLGTEHSLADNLSLGF